MKYKSYFFTIVVIVFSIGCIDRTPHTRTPVFPTYQPTPIQLKKGEDIPYDVSNSFFDEEISRLAIVYPDKKDFDHINSLDNSVTTALISLGYQVASRRDTNLILEEIKFQSTGLTQENIERIGKFLNVSAILVIRKFADKHKDALSAWTGSRLRLRLVSVKSTEVIWIDRGFENNIERSLYENFPKQGYSLVEHKSLLKNR